MIAVSLIDVRRVAKRYQMGETTIVAKRDINFTVNAGELAVILGPSGAGKSTVLTILGIAGFCLKTSIGEVADQAKIALRTPHEQQQHYRKTVRWGPAKQEKQ
ncbi:ATP-binding cassette domain-containing protein [Latilactobacillus graminis]|uniref:ABC transporter domain-containing protein n=2 Tax=Latilactobacillus graminis TaxID=60519 RepID=A0AA89I122_9LACO|nr:hypothetical protein FC90_GL000392 [Latilactobacillus graminis DSM 20719]